MAAAIGALHCIVDAPQKGQRQQPGHPARAGSTVQEVWSTTEHALEASAFRVYQGSEGNGSWGLSTPSAQDGDAGTAGGAAQHSASSCQSRQPRGVATMRPRPKWWHPPWQSIRQFSISGINSWQQAPAAAAVAAAGATTQLQEPQQQQPHQQLQHPREVAAMRPRPKWMHRPWRSVAVQIPAKRTQGAM